MASTISAVQSTNGTQWTWRMFIGSNQSATVGWSFQVGTQNVTLEALGIFDLDGNGMETAHPVGIWSDTGSLLAQVNVLAGTGSTLIDGYRYETTAPITLTAGATYYIGAYFGPVAADCSPACGDSVLFLSTQVYGPGINFLRSRQTQTVAGAGSLAFPNLDATVAEGVFGPNFRLAAADPDPTPEPSSLLLGGFGLSALVMIRRRHLPK